MATEQVLERKEFLESLWKEAVTDIVKYSNDDSQEGQWRKSTAQSAMVWLEMQIKKENE
jgi:hypothetical protein